MRPAAIELGRVGRHPAADVSGCGLWSLTFNAAAIGKPRMTQRDKWKVRDCVANYRYWADSVRLACIDQPLPDISTIVRVDWLATFAVPRKLCRAKQAALMWKPHCVKPDRDNIDKAILDALFQDDERIACGMLVKAWGLTSSLLIEIYHRR